MFKEYDIYKMYVRAGKADVEVIDVIDDAIIYKSINKRDVIEIEELSFNVAYAIDDYVNKDKPYLVAIPPTGYGL